MTADIAKLDFKKLMKPFWQPPAGGFEIVEVPALRFLMIDGRGDPNTAPAYRQAIEWLFTLSFTLKFASKEAGRDYGVAPLEGLWWADDVARFAELDRSDWHWTAMIMQPEWIGQKSFIDARTKAMAKRGEPPDSLRLEDFEEGLSVQTMHIGPYAEEAPTIARLHTEFLPAHGLVEAGMHHEIYLSDPGRTAAEKLRTIIRQPVRRAPAA